MSFLLPIPRTLRAFLASGVIGLTLLGATSVNAQKPKRPVKSKVKPKVKPTEAQTKAPASLRFAYALKTGETYRYQAEALIDGRFPPFAAPEGPPIHTRILLGFALEVKKQDDKGAEVAIKVESGELFLLEKEADDNGKLPPGAEEALFPIALDQVKAALEVTALVRPDGSVTNVTGGNASSQQISFGIELRKLFLLMLPVVFPDKPLKIADEWSFEEGLLGKNPGKTSYKSKLTGLRPNGKNLALQITHASSSKVMELKDKDGKPAAKEADAVDVTKGDATLTADLTYAAPAEAKANLYSGRLQQGRLVLIAKLLQTKPDPDQPGKKLEVPTDVRARLRIRSVAPPKKLAAPTFRRPA